MNNDPVEAARNAYHSQRAAQRQKQMDENARMKAEQEENLRIKRQQVDKELRPTVHKVLEHLARENYPGVQMVDVYEERKRFFGSKIVKHSEPGWRVSHLDGYTSSNSDGDPHTISTHYLSPNGMIFEKRTRVQKVGTKTEFRFFTPYELIQHDVDAAELALGGIRKLINLTSDES